MNENNQWKGVRSEASGAPDRVSTSLLHWQDDKYLRNVDCKLPDPQPPRASQRPPCPTAEHTGSSHRERCLANLKEVSSTTFGIFVLIFDKTGGPVPQQDVVHPSHSLRYLLTLNHRPRPVIGDDTFFNFVPRHAARVRKPTRTKLLCISLYSSSLSFLSVVVGDVPACRTRSTSATRVQKYLDCASIINTTLL
jgi:hypothetical protein